MLNILPILNVAISSRVLKDALGKLHAVCVIFTVSIYSLLATASIQVYGQETTD